MITQPSDIHVESNLVGHKIHFEVDVSATTFLIDQLIKNYSDDEMAIIREYSTNGWDSHVEAGNTNPIRVYTPSHLSSYLKIIDEGVGMSIDDLEQVYSQIGASTKRETNEQTGSLGIGAKCGLAYTNQFVLLAVKDGIQSHVIVSREDDGSASMTVVDLTDTDKADGVEIHIPTKVYNELEEKAKKLFSYWPAGQVLLNGKEPERIDGLKITDEIMIVQGGENKIVMGNIPYPAFFPNIRLRGEHAIVARVPIGSVSFAPSREALREQAVNTKETILRIVEEFNDNVDTAIQRTIDESTDPRDAFRVTAKWRSAVPAQRGPHAIVTKYTFKGKEIPSSFDPPFCLDPQGKVLEYREKFTVVNHNSHKMGWHSKDDSISAGVALSALWIHDYDLKFTANHKKKLQKYCEDNGISVNSYILTNHEMKSPWIFPEFKVKWEEIKKIKIERVQNRSGYGSRPTGSYDMYKNGKSYMALATEIDVKQPIYYINTTYNGKSRAHYANNRLKSIHDEYALVMLPANREAKFLRDFTIAKPVLVKMEELFNEQAKLITDDDWRSYYIQSDRYLSRELEKLDATKIDDPDLVKMIKAFEEIKVNKVANKIAEVEDFGQEFRFSLVRPEKIQEFEPPSDKKYPLLEQITRWGFDMDELGDHVYLYMNAVYAANKETEK